MSLSFHSLHAFPGAHDRHRPAPATIWLGTFGQSLQTLVAEQKGFFAEQNLTVPVLVVTSSTQQFQFLRDGQYDVISISPDNIVNYHLNLNNALGTLISGKVIAGTTPQGGGVSSLS